MKITRLEAARAELGAYVGIATRAARNADRYTGENTVAARDAFARDATAHAMLALESYSKVVKAFCSSPESERN